MANRIIKGKDLMLFDSNGKSYAYATNHTLTITAETSDVSSKDHGIWGGSEVAKYSWEITSENLYTSEGYSDMFDTMITGQAITVRFGLKTDTGSQTVADGDLANWTAGSHYYTGKVIITSLVANANNGENATYSITLTGTGALSKAGSVPSGGNSGGNSGNNGGNSGSNTNSGNATYNNNVTINGTSYNVSGGSVSINAPLTSISVTGANMDYLALLYGSNEEDELSINSAGTSASWTGNITSSSIQVYKGNGNLEDPVHTRWFTINYTPSNGGGNDDDDACDEN